MIKENNWLGRGVRLQSLLELTEQTISGNLAVTNPNFNYTNAKRQQKYQYKSLPSIQLFYKSTKHYFLCDTPLSIIRLFHNNQYT